ncbi:WhiB family transcriptional regulator [Microtetraspora malaysiensis]|uniref:WhiB family transcriptional regulator n=1 Tax=Microtetraspora malaysiensis TaxID=161358 RepID=UPI003D91BD9D
MSTICATDPALFTGPDAFEEEPIKARLKREREAKRICKSCEARPACLAYALDVRPEEGIWAGHTAARIRLMSIRSLVSK